MVTIILSLLVGLAAVIGFEAGRHYGWMFDDRANSSSAHRKDEPS